MSILFDDGCLGGSKRGAWRKNGVMSDVVFV